MENIPYEILYEICMFVPFKDLYINITVNKLWYVIITEILGKVKATIFYPIKHNPANLLLIHDRKLREIFIVYLRSIITHLICGVLCENKNEYLINLLKYDITDIKIKKIPLPFHKHNINFISNIFNSICNIEISLMSNDRFIIYLYLYLINKFPFIEFFNKNNIYIHLPDNFDFEL